jgi:hypothetical protein
MAKLFWQIKTKTNGDEMIRSFFALVVLFSSTLCAVSIDTMSESELKETGISKLSADEKKALSAWLAKSEPPKPVIEKGKIVHGQQKITDVIELGRFVTLENGKVYDIHSRSRKKTMTWKVGDTLRILETVKAPSYRLENVSQKKQTVSAKDKVVP